MRGTRTTQLFAWAEVHAFDMHEHDPGTDTDRTTTWRILRDPIWRFMAAGAVLCFGDEILASTYSEATAIGESAGVATLIEVPSSVLTALEADPGSDCTREPVA